VSIALVLDQRDLADPRIALAKHDAVALGQPHHDLARPVNERSRRWSAVTRHSSSVTSVWYRLVSRICCLRVVGVHMAALGLVSAPPWNHIRFQPLNPFRKGLLRPQRVAFGLFVLLVSAARRPKRISSRIASERLRCRCLKRKVSIAINSSFEK
jgi:hypothetical protein